MMLNVQHPAPKLTEKTFQPPRSSPTCTLAALSHMMVEWATTSRIASARPETLSEWWTSLKVIPVQHQDQTKTIPELCAFQPTLRLGMLEDDIVWREQVVHLPYKEPQKDPAYFLTWDHLQPRIEDIRNWMLNDKLKLNDDKTEFMIIGTSQQLAKVSINSLCVGTATITPVSSARNLGLWFDSKLTMAIHI